MKLYHSRQLLHWLAESDPYDYCTAGELNETVPEELREPLQKLTNYVEDYHRQLFSQRQLEYHALQSRINPHFLYNTLEAVRAQALEIGADDIEGMVGCISRFFRYSISSRREFVTLREELDNIKDYFKIQQYRFQDRFTLKIIMDDEGVKDVELPKMLLQPVVENAVFHGLEPKKGTGTVTIRLLRVDEDLHLTVSDNGVGIPENQLERLNDLLNIRQYALEQGSGQTPHHGALLNVNARIHLYCGENYGVFLHSISGIGTDTELILPCTPPGRRNAYDGAGNET